MSSIEPSLGVSGVSLEPVSAASLEPVSVVSMLESDDEPLSVLPGATGSVPALEQAVPSTSIEARIVERRRKTGGEKKDEERIRNPRWTPAYRISIFGLRTRRALDAGRHRDSGRHFAVTPPIPGRTEESGTYVPD